MTPERLEEIRKGVARDEVGMRCAHSSWAEELLAVLEEERKAHAGNHAAWVDKVNRGNLSDLRATKAEAERDEAEAKRAEQARHFAGSMVVFNERDALRIRVAELEAALLGLRVKENCWVSCDEFPGPWNGKHEPECEAARAALARKDDKP